MCDGCGSVATSAFFSFFFFPQMCELKCSVKIKLTINLQHWSHFFARKVFAPTSCKIDHTSSSRVINMPPLCRRKGNINGKKGEKMGTEKSDLEEQTNNNG
ncbi:hypothetical protein POVWA2_040150 [Plasmodium ovale wallikeri]|uniref:Uncharacterized protein n=1 Tax=Plasmodium ovale wallikeri TaxID=864142 RepID=A0A1A8Z8M6_PLAOA|nr:hypothetical protein POVWA1_041590 [Plasmodium ovale wallikeri]SBT40638.1 hypothetical protein POVWA2_040150 [Plasmodium ovale wallikeri]